MRPIAPNRIVVLDSEASPTAAAPPKTMQWDPVPPSPPMLRRRAPGSNAPSGKLSRETVALARSAAPERPDPRALSTIHSLPAPRGEARPWVEEAETMHLPAGASEDMLGAGQPPIGPIEARIAMTRLSRELGRQYRHRYAMGLTVDAAGIEAMQHHLLRRLAELRCDQSSAALLEAELTRHGAFLSEILARRLGAEWLEVGDAYPTDWAMRVGPGFRVWPVWRIHNFLRQRWDGRGALVSFYVELQARLPRK